MISPWVFINLHLNSASLASVGTSSLKSDELSYLVFTIPKGSPLNLASFFMLPSVGPPYGIAVLTTALALQSGPSPSRPVSCVIGLTRLSPHQQQQPSQSGGLIRLRLAPWP